MLDDQVSQTLMGEEMCVSKVAVFFCLGLFKE